MRRHKWRLVIFSSILIINLTSLTGCWNSRDISVMALVTAIGLDKTDDDQVELTVQIIKPSAIRFTDQGGGGGESPVWVYSVKGYTVFDAVRNTYSTLNGRLFINQVQLIVIGEELAQDNILESLDFFEREMEFNIKSHIAITRGMTAKELLKAESQLDIIPSLHLINIIDNSSKTTAKTKRLILFDLLQEMSKLGQESIIPAIEASETADLKNESTIDIKDLEIGGAAVLKGERLVGWLNPNETRGLLFVDNEVKSTIINIMNPLNPNKYVSIEVLGSKSKKDVEIKGGNISLIIEIEQMGSFGEQRGKGDLTTPEMVEKLEEEMGKAVEKDIRNAFRQAQTEYKSDIFGFGEIVRRKYSDYWKDNKNNWNDLFSLAEVEVKVKSKLTRTGYISQPTQND